MLYEIEVGKVQDGTCAYQIHYYDDTMKYLATSYERSGYASFDEAYDAGEEEMMEAKKHDKTLRCI